MECERETTTQHHGGPAGSFGPVQNDEQIVFAVFDDIERDGLELQANSFDNNDLKRTQLSLARGRHTARATFDQHVVRPGTNPRGALVGVAKVLVDEVRKILATIRLNSGTESVRAFCVLDLVEPGDYDGHCTVGYGERTSANLSQKQINEVRAKARLDLADAFSPIMSPDGVAWSQ